MIKTYRQIIGTPIVRQEDGAILALIQDIIIHPDTGKIEAFWVKALALPMPNAILQTESILEWKKNIYIKDEREIADPSDIIKISETLSRNTLFIGNLARNEAGEIFGGVYDLDFDVNKLFLKNLYVQKSFLGFKYNQRMFHYDNIIKVLPEYILVKDIEEKKVKVEKPALDKQPLLDV